MLIIEPETLLLQSTIPIYNNVGNCGNTQGRLTVSLQMEPDLRLFWEYERVGNSVRKPLPKETDNDGNLADRLRDPLTGFEIEIKKPYVLSKYRGFKSSAVSGYALEVSKGNIQNRYTTFYFYLPNLRSCKIAPDKYSGEIHAHLNQIWQVSLETDQKALDWLRVGNIGTRFTTLGTLTSRPKSDGEPEITLAESRLILERLTRLLSFANGGELGPLYIEATEENYENVANLITAYPVTPLQQLNPTWLTFESDLENFIQCYAAFEKMLEKPDWEDSLEIILLWYFESLQTPFIPIKAVALGSIIEYLLQTLPIEWGGKYGNKGVDKLLAYMGIQVPKNEIENFWKIRNRATHKKAELSLSSQDQGRLLHKATQWVEEILLWRLGYNGKYLDRSQEWRTAIEPRYDLSKRLPDW